MSEELKNAIEILVAALREDADYRRSWKDNIAMAVKDSDSTFKSLHEIANEGAERFLNLLCHVQ